MTRALICTGVLGGGTAVVFALALAVSMLFPQGSMVPVAWNGPWGGGWAKPMPMPGGGVIVSDDLIVTQVGEDVWVNDAVPAPAPVEVDS